MLVFTPGAHDTKKINPLLAQHKHNAEVNVQKWEKNGGKTAKMYFTKGFILIHAKFWFMKDKICKLYSKEHTNNACSCAVNNFEI